LRQIEERIRPRGRAIINVLIEVTSYLGRFKPEEYYLFGTYELQRAFGGWGLLPARSDSFPAPDGTRKGCATVIARKAQP